MLNRKSVEHTTLGIYLYICLLVCCCCCCCCCCVCVCVCWCLLVFCLCAAVVVHIVCLVLSFPQKMFTKSLSQRIRHVRYMRLRAQRGCEDIWELERDVYLNRERRGGGDVANVYLDRDGVSSLPPPSQQ